MNEWTGVKRSEKIQQLVTKQDREQMFYDLVDSIKIQLCNIDENLKLF